jgi:hypothetical protein
MAGNDDGAVAKDYVAIRVNVSSAQLNQVLTALAIAPQVKTKFKPGHLFLLQRKTRGSGASRGGRSKK